MSIQVLEKSIEKDKERMVCENNLILEKRKNDENKCENNAQNGQKNIKNAKIKKYEPIKTKKSETYDMMTAWIKALLTVYPSIPNIVSVIDNIILNRATSSINMSSVYTSSTLSQIEKVIDLSDRKLKLLNILALVKEILSPLSEKDYQVIDLRFFRRMKSVDIAEKLNIDERTVFRKISRILDKSVSYCTCNCYDLYFIESAVKGENWIKEIYNKSMNEIAQNKVRSASNKRFYDK